MATAILVLYIYWAGASGAFHSDMNWYCVDCYRVSRHAGQCLGEISLKSCIQMLDLVAIFTIFHEALITIIVTTPNLFHHVNVNRYSRGDHEQPELRNTTHGCLDYTGDELAGANGRERFGAIGVSQVWISTC